MKGDETHAGFEFPVPNAYLFTMTQLLERALDAVRRLSPDAQDEIARAILALTEEQPSEDIDPSHLNDVLESLAQARNREFATETEIDEAFSRFSR